MIYSLPLDIVLLTISELLPKVREFQAARSKPSTTAAVMDFLRGVSMSDILPPIRPSTPRKFVVSVEFNCTTATTEYYKLTVVRIIDNLAYIYPYLGRNLCPWDGSPGDMEFNTSSLVLRQTSTTNSASHHIRDSLECHECYGVSLWSNHWTSC